MDFVLDYRKVKFRLRDYGESCHGGGACSELYRCTRGSPGDGGTDQGDILVRALASMGFKVGRHPQRMIPFHLLTKSNANITFICPK